jgi:glycosyltransferase involved in cell wall biosynthesis
MATTRPKHSSDTGRQGADAPQHPKLIVVIPAYNEEETIAAVIAEIPRSIDGVGSVEVLVLDDGSTDRTGAVALAAGADYIVAHKKKQGLASAFSDALQEALRLGADIIVSTDADNHYDQSRIPELIRPILDEKADITVGSRNIRDLPAKWTNKWGNIIGSFLVRRLAGLPSGVDVSTGFRAYAREAALQLNVISNHTYTHETLIAAQERALSIVNVPTPARPVSRPSRLIQGIFGHIFRALLVIFRTYAVYQPIRVFIALALILILAGLAPMARFLVYFFSSDGGGHVQSLIAGSVLLLVGFQVLVLSLLASAIAWNRKMLEEILSRERRRDYDQGP